MDAKTEKRIDDLEAEVMALRGYIVKFASVTEPAIKKLAEGLTLQKRATLDIGELIAARPERPGDKAGLN